MLVLTRKKEQEVVIGDNIKVTVLRVGDGRVRLGFSAPPDGLIRRTELDARIANHRRATGKSVTCG